MERASLTKYEYEEERVKRKGYSSLTAYHKILDEIQRGRDLNQKISMLIKKGLKRIGKNQSWLSRQLEVSREAISEYVTGNYIPAKSRLEKMMECLEYSPAKIEEILKEYPY